MAFTMGTFAKAVKKCAFNPSISDMDFLNALYAPYIDAGRIEKRGCPGISYEFDRHRASRIINGEANVPDSFKKVWLQHGLENRMLDGCEILFDETADPELFKYAQSEILDLIDGKDARSLKLINDLEKKIDDPSRFLACAIIGTIGFDNRQNPERIILKKDCGMLCWRTGDLLNYGFHNRKKARNLVVVPVNCEFDTHVTRAYEDVEMQLVSEKTIHGQWLTRMQQSGMPEAEIARRIQKSLSATNSSQPIGTIVAIDTDRATYILLAISSFDENGVARSKSKDIEESLIALLRFYEQNGQGADMYLPLLGSGLGKSGLSKRGTFAMIEKIVGESQCYLSGKLTVVMRSDDASEIGLLEREV